MPPRSRTADTSRARGALARQNTGTGVPATNGAQSPLVDVVSHYANDFAQVLPQHLRADTFVRLAHGVVRRNDKLRRAAEANPPSFLAALLDCARLGHEPGTDQYALVPFGDEIVGIEQYQGAIERMYRAGAVVSVLAEVVREHDHWRFNRSVMTVPDHQPDDFASDEERGALRGVYAYARMQDGSTSRVVVMGRAEVMKHKAVSRGASKSDSPWNGPFEQSMWLKTAVHELEKWVPTSAEYRRELARAAAAADRIPVLSAPAAPPPPARPAPDPRIVDMPAAREPEPQSAPGPPPAVDTTTGEITDPPPPDAADPSPAAEPAPEGEHARQLREQAAASWGDDGQGQLPDEPS